MKNNDKAMKTLFTVLVIVNCAFVGVSILSTPPTPEAELFLYNMLFNLLSITVSVVVSIAFILMSVKSARGGRS